MTRSRSVLDTSTSFGPGQCADARADVHGDPADVVAADLALAGVQSGAHLDAERLHRVADRHRAADRPLRAVEHREEAVTRRAHLAAPKTRQLCPHHGVVCIEQRMPVTVAHLRRPPRRVHDVGEQHRGENPIIGHLCLMTGEELGDLLERGSPRFDEVVQVAARQLNVFRTRYGISDVLALLGRDQLVVGVLEHERWHTYGRQYRPYVDFGQQRHQKSHSRGARRQALCSGPRCSDLLVPWHVRIHDMLNLARAPHGDHGSMLSSGSNPPVR